MEGLRVMEGNGEIFWGKKILIKKIRRNPWSPILGTECRQSDLKLSSCFELSPILGNCRMMPSAGHFSIVPYFPPTWKKKKVFDL